MDKKIVFRCDFEKHTGWGHLVRSSTLAKAYKDNSFRTLLATTTSPQKLPEDIESAFSEIIHFSSEAHFLEWLHLTQHHLQLAILDHYQYSIFKLDKIEEILSATHPNLPLLAFTDTPPPPQNIPQNLLYLFIGPISEKFNQSTPHPQVLAGLQYILIRKDFHPQPELHIPSSLKKIVIIMGGTDPSHATPALLQSFIENDYANKIHPIIVLNKQHSQSSQVTDLLQNFKSFEWHEALSSAQLNMLYNSSDFIISACGGTVFEIAACQKPFIGIMAVENQSPNVEVIENLWHLPVIPTPEIHSPKFESALNSFLEKTSHSYKFVPEIDNQGPLRTLQKVNAYFNITL